MDQLAPQVFVRIANAVAHLRAEGLRLPSVSKLRGEENIYRMRVGDYRVIFLLEEGNNEIMILAIRHRKDVYEALKRRLPR